MMQYLSNPMVLGAAVGVVLLILATMYLGRNTTPKAATINIPREVAKYVEEGHYGRAAAAAANLGRFDLAVDYYLRAQQPEQAANMAIKLGNTRQGAELYERAGVLSKAVTYYERAGMAEKVRELKARLAEAKGQAAITDTSNLSGTRALVAQYRALADQAAAAQGDVGKQADAQAAAKRAAEALLADGNLEQAADIYADANMNEDAVHLYVNVLGLPGKAAPILAKLGLHDRAAEFYERAGEQERAAASWSAVARAAPDPEPYLDRIEQLSRREAKTLLEDLVARRAVAADTVELFYRLALLLRGDEQARALSIFSDIESKQPGYKDVALQVTQLSVTVNGGGNAGGSANTAPLTPRAKGASSPPDALTLLDPSQLQALADQVARAAAEQLKRSTNLEITAVKLAPNVKTVIREGVGLELSKIELDLAFDSAVQGARLGASIDSLLRFTGGRPCDLGNIEVFYRLGLAHMAGGDWDAAAKAFDEVEDASPGYRDAWQRAEEIRRWANAIGDKRTRLGGATKTGDSGRYQLRGELGRGGMAIVYRGFDSVLDREVALKFLSSEMSAMAEVRDMFQREGRAVAQLNHPNIVTIHDVGVLDGRAFLCMEFVEGKSVEGMLLDPAGITIVESTRIVAQVLSALSYAHSRKIIHRDIKPANFMRGADGHVKLMDFGLAKSLDSGRQQSVIAGTPQYMAPEQLRGGMVDHRTDLFAVAVSMYELFTGQMPFEGMERNAPPPPPTDHIPAIPEILSEVVMKGLAFDPNDRWQTADDMREPLMQVLNEVERASGITGAKRAVATNQQVAAAATELLS